MNFVKTRIMTVEKPLNLETWARGAVFPVKKIKAMPTDYLAEIYAMLDRGGLLLSTAGMDEKLCYDDWLGSSGYTLV
jgi:hypothetical protein